MTRQEFDRMIQEARTYPRTMQADAVLNILTQAVRSLLPDGKPSMWSPRYWTSGWFR